MNGFYYGRRVLITGGLGFIGSNLAIALVEQGAHVTLLDSMIPEYGATLDNIAPVHQQVVINFSDIRDVHSLPYLVRDQEIIFSLAGQVSHIDSMQQPLIDLDINCRSQLSLLECCRQFNPQVRLVFASTRQIYGKTSTVPVTEDHPCDPADVNGINKLASEMYYRLYANVHGLATVSLRLTNTYGPRMDLQNLKKGFVGVFIKQALAGEVIRVFGDGTQRRDFNYISDVVQALLLAGSSTATCGQCFNLGNAQHHSLIEFLEILNKHIPLRYECIPFPAELRAIDIGSYYANYDRFFHLTGWQPHVSLDAGLQMTAQYYATA